jgi:TonB family protein
MKKVLISLFALLLSVAAVRAQADASAAGAQRGGEKSHPAEPKMVLLKGGTFQMGCSSSIRVSGVCHDDETPQHSVKVYGFYIGKYEVTQAQWRLIMGNNPSKFKGDKRPVENVSWDDVQEFISRLNAATGKKYRLPTEAEWEYAARGGNDYNPSRMFSGCYNCTDWDDLDEVAWFYNNSDLRTHNVGTKKKSNPNSTTGIYDMSGNVAEWCSDWYDDKYYRRSAKNNPMGASSGSDRVIRGCHWHSEAPECYVCSRDHSSPDKRNDYTGFRVVLPDTRSRPAEPDTVKVEEIIPFASVEVKPKFQDKDADKFKDWINSRLTYPAEAMENNIQGTVHISFTVNTDGTLSDVKSTKKVNPLLEECAVATVKKSPKWTPGRQRGKPVNVSCQVPVTFKIEPKSDIYPTIKE